MTPLYQVTFVCMGNICRSPTAHGVFRQKVLQAGWADAVGVDSAGTHGYHPGEPPDRRSQVCARARGYELADLRARTLTAHDFEAADLLLVVDADNLAHAEQRCPPRHRHKLRRLTEFCLVHRSAEVPDPYCGGQGQFEHVLDLIEDACDGLVAHVRLEIEQRQSAGRPAPSGAKVERQATAGPALNGKGKPPA